LKPNDHQESQGTRICPLPSSANCRVCHGRVTTTSKTRGRHALVHGR
jgi:hypothetical protein